MVLLASDCMQFFLFCIFVSLVKDRGKVHIKFAPLLESYGRHEELVYRHAVVQAVARLR